MPALPDIAGAAVKHYDRASVQLAGAQRLGQTISRLPSGLGEVGAKVPAVNLFATTIADGHRLRGLTARLMHELQRRMLDLVPIAPAQDCQQDRVQILALLGEDVFVTDGVLSVGLALEDLLVHQQLQPSRQDVTPELQFGLDILVTAD